MQNFSLSIESKDLVYSANIEVYLRNNVEINKTPLPIVIICPGGGYSFLSTRESEPIALAFLSQGFHAVVLNYTTMSNSIEGNFLHSTILQVAKTFELINENKKEWNVDSSQIFLLGCSAGGHLAASYSTVWKKFEQKEINYKPKGTILCYPVIGFEYGWPENLAHFNFTLEDPSVYDASNFINAETPDTFIWHTASDTTVPVLNTLKYCENLTKNNIPFECHIFENGQHGLALATKSTAKMFTNDYVLPEVANWFSTCIDWINRRL
ncbi:alpha/beta hydrolase [Enterococcus faecium]|uniref:alpha/beta hydrolase n=1 Tax=Enterococcus TaxID=1350 RepID=UPI000B7285CA|nr:alpha/beta hydrolase [Enterococcus faecium]OTN78292.1 hypothetical protein A5826_002144 [Enterococcus faecium]